MTKYLKLGLIQAAAARPGNTDNCFSVAEIHLRIKQKLIQSELEFYYKGNHAQNQEICFALFCIFLQGCLLWKELQINQHEELIMMTNSHQLSINVQFKDRFLNVRKSGFLKGLFFSLLCQDD